MARPVGGVDDRGMAHSSPAVLVFGGDGELIPLPTLAEAAGFIEAIDVLNGEYDAVFTLDGRLVHLSAEEDGGPVMLAVTGQADLPGLQRRLQHAQPRERFTSDPADPRAVANELLTRAWQQCRPQRPRWLDRLLHGDPPTSR
jgi:hypothetical protein